MGEMVYPDTNRLASACLNLFDSIPKTGKPVADKEWTILSCIAKFNHQTEEIEVVSLGTGKITIIFIISYMFIV